MSPSPRRRNWNNEQASEEVFANASVCPISVGDTDTVTISLNGDDVTDQVNYEVADESVATVVNGTVTGVGSGTTTVTVSMPNVNSVTFEVNVSGNPFARAEVGDYVELGSFVQAKVPESDPVEWQVQPIEWQVLHIDEENNRVLIVSRYLLDLRVFDNTSNVWSSSSIRSWLNNDFYNTVFTDKEKGYIAYSELTDVGTTDNVFLLSNTEAETYFDNATVRRCTPTSFICIGGCVLLLCIVITKMFILFLVVFMKVLMTMLNAIHLLEFVLLCG